MKIGILTFHRAHNYGAVLQCYALASVLKERGHEVEVIDYYPSYFKAEYSFLPKLRVSFISWAKEIIAMLPIASIKYKRITLFNMFIENVLPLSKTQYDEKARDIQGYDLIFFGSDQIWNPLLSDGVDPIYSGLFEKKGAKFVSYAASTNPAICTDEYSEYFKNIIDAFDSISVREQSLADYLNNIKPLSAQVVLDPVLLPDITVWDRIAKKPVEENYLLIYTVPQSAKVLEHARFVAKQFGLKIIELTSKARKIYRDGVKQEIGPTEFIGFFKYASYIVTTSFHGTAFSIKFNKPFSNISIGAFVDDRAKNLLSSLGILDRQFYNPVDEHALVPMNYSVIEKRLNLLRSESLKFIDLNLNATNND